MKNYTHLLLAVILVSTPAFATLGQDRGNQESGLADRPRLITDTQAPDTFVNIYHKDVVGMWFVVPKTGTIDSIYFDVGDSVGVHDSIVYIRIHKSFIKPGAGPGYSYPSPPTKWGNWMNTDDLDRGMAAFIEEASDPTWQSTITPKSFAPFGEEVWGFGGVSVILRANKENSLNLNIIGAPGVNSRDVIFVSMRANSDPSRIPGGHEEQSDEGRTEIGAYSDGVYSPSRTWKFFEHDSGWHAIDGVNLGIRLVGSAFGYQAVRTIAASAGPHGIIAPSGNVDVDSNGTQTFTFNADHGYMVDSVIVDGSPVFASQSYTFENVTEDHTIYVSFRKLGGMAGVVVKQSIFSRALTFGVRPGAGYGIYGVDPAASSVDSKEGELEVPPPVGGVFDARFVDPRGDVDYFGQGSWVDVRNFTRVSQTDSFLVRFQRTSGGAPVVIQWPPMDIASMFNGTVTIGQTSGTVVDMKTNDSIVVTNLSHSEYYIVAKSPNLPVIYEIGWNLVSLPLEVEDGSVGVLFPGISSTPFSFDAIAGYQIESDLIPGPGYWLKFPFVIQNQEYSGTERLSATLDVSAGWNLIGTLTNPISVASIGSDPPGIVTGQFFGYNRGFYPTMMLEPRRGYWVNSTQAGQLFLSTTASNFPSRIVIRPTRELPPPPPGGESHVSEPYPTQYSLTQNYPNPFNPTTTIQFTVPEKSYVRLQIFNVLGQVVTTLVDGEQEAGYKSVQWDATNLSGGVYFYRIMAGSFTETKKMLIIR